MNTKKKQRIKKTIRILIVSMIGLLAAKGFVVASIIDKTLVSIGILFITYITFICIKIAYLFLTKNNTSDS